MRRLNIWLIFCLMLVLVGCSDDKVTDGFDSSSVSAEQPDIVTDESDIVEVTNAYQTNSDDIMSLEEQKHIPTCDEIDISYLISTIEDFCTFYSQDSGYQFWVDGDNLLVSYTFPDNKGLIEYLRYGHDLYFKNNYKDMKTCYQIKDTDMLLARSRHGIDCETVSSDLKEYANISFFPDDYNIVKYIGDELVDTMDCYVFATDLKPLSDTSQNVSYVGDEERYTYWYIDKDSGECVYMKIPIDDMYGNVVYVCGDVTDCVPDGVRLSQYYDMWYKDIGTSWLENYKFDISRMSVKWFAAISDEDAGDYITVLTNTQDGNFAVYRAMDEMLHADDDVNQNMVDIFAEYFNHNPQVVQELLYEQDAELYLQNSGYDKEGTSIGHYSSDSFVTKNIFYEANSERYLVKSVNHEIGHFMDEILGNIARQYNGATFKGWYSHNPEFTGIYNREGGNLHLSADAPEELFAEAYRTVIDNDMDTESKIPEASAYVRRVLKEVINVDV